MFSVAWGTPVQSILSSLGMEWQLARVAPTYTKEREKIQEVQRRLTRLMRLPCSFRLRASAISVGCLSMLDYAPTPTPKLLHPIKLAIKKALGLAWGAPEVAFHDWSKSTLDPELRWVLSVARLVRMVANSQEFRSVLACVRSSRKGSRTAMLINMFRKRGWEVKERGFYCPD